MTGCRTLALRTTRTYEFTFCCAALLPCARSFTSGMLVWTDTYICAEAWYVGGMMSAVAAAAAPTANVAVRMSSHDRRSKAQEVGKRHDVPQIGMSLLVYQTTCIRSRVGARTVHDGGGPFERGPPPVFGASRGVTAFAGVRVTPAMTSVVPSFASCVMSRT